MSASQIRKNSHPTTQMETDSNNQPLQKPTSADRYQQMTLDSDALVALDKAWLDARESSKIDPGIIDKVNNIGQKYGEQVINMISTNMILIDGFHKDCPTETILEIIKTFNDNNNIRIDMAHTIEKLKKIIPGLQFYNQQKSLQHHCKAHQLSALQLIGRRH